MKTSKQHLGFRQTLIALAVLSAFGPAAAQEVAAPQNSVTIGGTYANGDSQDRARFGLYNGMREDSSYGLFDFTYLNRDAATGLWTTIEGRNLFLDTRELTFTTRKLGDWKLTAGYNEILRSEPRTINTGMQGAGTSTPVVVRPAAVGGGQDVNLELKRKAFTLSGAKWFGGALQFEASLKSEEKEGARIFGKGFACSSTWVSRGLVRLEHHAVGDPDAARAGGLHHQPGRREAHLHGRRAAGDGRLLRQPVHEPQRQPDRDHYRGR